MAGMRATHKKNGVTFKYSGDLQENIEKARKELEKKRGSQERVFLNWQKEKAVKAFNSYEQRIVDLESFVELGKKELKEGEEKEDGYRI